MKWFARLFSSLHIPASEDSATASSMAPAMLSMEEELRKTERRLETLLDQLPHVILYETGGGREYISNNIEKLLGYSANELTRERSTFPSLIHPSDHQTHLQGLAKWTERGRLGVFVSQFRVRKRSGEYVWLEDQITAVSYEDGRSGTIGVMVDVTERHAAQKRYQAIVEAADVAGIGLAILVNRGGIPMILYVNEAAHVMCGRTLEEVIERPIVRFLPRDAWGTIKNLWEQFRDGKLLRHSFETELLHKEGHHIPVSVGVTAVSLDDEPAVIAFITDITERKEVEKALVIAKIEAEEISNVKSTILSNFSHELRTPLHSILGFSSVLSEELNDEHLREYSYSIHRSGKRLLSTLTSIIELAALESSPGGTVLYPMLLSEETIVAAEAIEDAVNACDLSLVVDIRKRTAVVLLDRTRFQKAFDKIASNALKFTHQGSIHIILTEESRISSQGRMEEWAILCVRDSGIGMSPEFLHTAFEKFKQASTGSSRTYEGTGLGLPLARGYIKLMGGEIELSSELGKGTEVIIRFPIVERWGSES
ncbi:MAG TPA: PAS domain S-box protein [Candidatus Kapabacteria bacterium]|nr:PAS domain S-box protein [Candidatus Kapabacteria bacterium]